jgi:hypothetical protein
MNASFAVPATINEPGADTPDRRERPQHEPESQVAVSQTAIVIPEYVAAAGTCPDVRFAQQQICGLIQRVFFPGWPKPSRQVVIASADAQTDTALICARLAHEMVNGLPGTVCAVEADRQSLGLGNFLAGSIPQRVEQKSGAYVPVSKNLWLAEPDSLFSAENDGFSAVWLRTRMSELRRNFDYTLIHAPAAFLTQTLVLGQLADGLILAIRAGKTHRAVAQTTLTTLKAAKVGILGTVLMDRTFPIPEKLYQRL